MSLWRRTITLAALVVAGCRGQEQPRHATVLDRAPDPGRPVPVESSRPVQDDRALSLRVYDDESRFDQLAADAAVAKKRNEAEWRSLAVDRDFKKEKRFHCSLAEVFSTLPPAEKNTLLAWLAANPLPRADDELVARLTLGDVRALDAVVAALAQGSAQRKQSVLSRLGWFDWSHVPALRTRREQILLPLLDQTDRALVEMAATCIERQGEAFWWEPVRQRILDPRYRNRSVLVEILKKSSSPEAIELTKAAMALRTPDEEPAPFVEALEQLAAREGAAPDVRKKADEALFAAVETDRPERCGSAYARLFLRDPKRTLPLAERYLFHAMKQPTVPDEYNVSLVLREWARLRGKDGQRLLRTWIGHPRLGRSALEILTELKVGSGDETLIGAWRKYAADKKDPHVYHQVAAIGGEKAKQAAVELLKQSGASPSRELGLWWTLNDITLDKALRLSVQHGLLERMPSEQSVQAALRETGALESPFVLWMAVMVREGRAAHFDTETSTFPNRHDELIMGKLKQGGGGLFVPGKAVEVWRPKGEIYDVAFEHRGKWYHFRAKGLGDWYDVVSVLEAVNKALADVGVGERFHALETGGQDAFLLLARPDGLAAVAAELRLPVASNPDSARELGKAFENEMLRRLGVDPRRPVSQ
jgi:hypothetical protein